MVQDGGKKGGDLWKENNLQPVLPCHPRSVCLVFSLVFSIVFSSSTGALLQSQASVFIRRGKVTKCTTAWIALMKSLLPQEGHCHGILQTWSSALTSEGTQDSNVDFNQGSAAFPSTTGALTSQPLVLPWVQVLPSET